MKKLILFVLMLLPLVASADDSGKCGENVYYSYNAKTHTFTVYGEGGMSNYDSPVTEFEEELDYRPWRSYCKEIEYLIIESGVTYLGRNAFWGFSGLTSVTIPNSVRTIGAGAFDWCDNLTSLILPNGVEKIYGDHMGAGGAFAHCRGLTSVTIPHSVTYIGESAFAYCTSLSSITIPSSVTGIYGGESFSGCSNLTSITVESGNPKYDSRNNCNAIIDSNNQLIVGCKNTTIPNSVTSIGRCAFYGHTGLTSIVIPEKVTSIGAAAFSYCAGLVYVTLPSNLISIGEPAFGSCNSLTDVYCKAVNVPSASSYTFSNQGNITLHAPNESLSVYKTTEPWNKFDNYESLSSSDLQASKKCSKPTINIVNGRAVFNCETADVYYRWSISTPSGRKDLRFSYYNYVYLLPITLNVFATKSGYLPSDVATYEFSGLEGDVNNDGEVNVADHVKLSDIIMDQK